MNRGGGTHKESGVEATKTHTEPLTLWLGALKLNVEMSRAYLSLSLSILLTITPPPPSL